MRWRASIPTMRKPSRDLVLAKTRVLAGVPGTVHIEEKEGGAFLTATLWRPYARTTVQLGTLSGVARWAAAHRRGEPFWMLPAAGVDPARIPGETQALFLQLGRRYAVIIPLVQAPLRCCLRGGAGGVLEVMLDSGDARTVADSCTVAFVAVGDDLHELMGIAARAVAKRLGAVPLRADKPLPPWVDGLGWCTWDAFYQEVDQAKVRQGLESFRAIGIRPRMMILDDGWQSERTTATGERRLTAFAPNRKFGGDLSPTVRMAKGEFGIGSFLVWHAFHGYWGGVDGAAMPGYRVVEQTRTLSPYLTKDSPSIDEWWGQAAGVVHPERIAAFYHDYHHLLASQGVDGVKVDNQASHEGLAQGLGGRVRMMQTYRAALEGSVAEHFAHSLINCMSCSNEMLYNARSSNLTRTSTDFWPKKPESHGLHLWTNALVSLWFGEFIHPDWDMFQSDHERAWFHAAARAISGGPVYVSDKPGRHDAALLRALTCHDGGLLRCREPARPAADCVFHDPLSEDVALKLINRTAIGGVVGVFNAQYHAEATARRTIKASVSPADVPGLAGTRFAVRLQQADRIVAVARRGRVPLALAEGGWELAAIVPISGGFAALGLADKLNGSMVVTAVARSGRSITVDLRDGGRFAAWCSRAPRRVEAGGKALRWKHDRRSGGLNVVVPGEGPVQLVISW